MNQPEDLILIVGSNPLPNYVAVAILKPKRVHLVHSTDTRSVMTRLKSCIEAPPLSITVAPPNQYEIDDATDVPQIRRIAERLPKAAVCHHCYFWVYSG